MSPQVYLTRKTRFSASHRYHQKRWSDEENRRFFGPCNNPWGHGHNYDLEVSITGDLDAETGMVLNLTDVDRVLEEEVVSQLDHRHLNHEIEAFAETIPTTENISLWIWERLEPKFRALGSRLHRVRLWESSDLYVEYFGGTESADS